MVVSVIMMPAAFTPKSSSLVITPGKPSIRMRWPCCGKISKTITQRSPARLARPVVVRNHDLMIFGISAGSNERAAIAGSRQPRRLRRLLPLIQPWDVVVRHFLEGVERDNVVNIQLNPVCLHAVGNPLEFLLI